MKVLCSVFLCLCGYSIIAQSLPAQVISTSGDNFMKTNGSLEWTLGEIMIESYSRPVGFLTQGFQQPSKVTITNIERDIENGIAVYPNPVREVLFVKITEAGTYTIELFNLLGQRVVNENSIVQSTSHTQEVAVQALSAAMYLLRVTNISSGKNSIQKIEKH
ncbi:MAG TPA: hypothetical protein DIS90_12250 [Cytophagales bacterium]|nr:hypothetical protein [Cytophagales bacterium]